MAIYAREAPREKVQGDVDWLYWSDPVGVKPITTGISGLGIWSVLGYRVYYKKKERRFGHPFANQVHFLDPDQLSLLPDSQRLLCLGSAENRAGSWHEYDAKKHYEWTATIAVDPKTSYKKSGLA